MSIFKITLSFLLIFCLSFNANAGKAQEQQKTLKMKDETLSQLFKKKPHVRKQIESAPGYAVFSSANVNLVFMAVGGGYGLVKNMKTGRYTYMKMAEGGVGLGLGAKDYRLVMIFHTTQAMNYFIEKGWTFGGNADAAVKASDKGRSVEGEAYYGDVTVFTFTESGLALQAVIKGTKFWKDDKLN